jgi:hypothetical protein
MQECVVCHESIVNDVDRLQGTADIKHVSCVDVSCFLSLQSPVNNSITKLVF